MKFDFIYFDELPSTNDTAKQKASSGAPEGTVVIARKQSAGRGRVGRSFYSPEGGIYMSVILRPRFSRLTLITPAAAAAVCKALESLGFDCRIKWVNDIYKADKKVCGILTESNLDEGWAVLGVGINTVCPGVNAPEIAGWLYDNEADNDKIIKLVLSEFSEIYEKLPDDGFIKYYREKSYLKGKKILINGAEYDYKGIDDDFGLLAEKDGKTYKFVCGEVSVKTVV